MLNSTIPSAHKLSFSKPKLKSSAQQLFSSRFDDDDDNPKLPDLSSDDTFLHSSEFQEYENLYNNKLDHQEKLCLLCCAVFPKNEVIKKRLVINWWIGEGFLDNPPPDQTRIEDLAEEILKKLADTGFIEPVFKKRRREVHSFKLNPVVHSALKFLARSDKFFDYDSNWNPIGNSQLSHRVCLVEPEERYDVEDEKDLEPALFKVRGLELERIETLFNISKIILDFSSDWFSKLQKLRVLFLGRWQESLKHHVEVESTEFLNGFKKMKKLRFLSLQGISRIFELPKLLSGLTGLMILDLRACHNLEVLPKEIGMLKKLTHLDISECYLLDRVPKEIASLSALEVLKGFVVACVPNEKSCTLAQLVALGKLRKLSITTNVRKFPDQNSLVALRQMKKLTILRIVWGYDFQHKMMEVLRTEPNQSLEASSTEVLSNMRVSSTELSQTDESFDHQDRRVSPIELPLGANEAKPMGASEKGFLENLKKLDLQCCPEKQTPNWLMPDHVKNLEKLYIKGGELHKLSSARKEDKWDKVEILCLKFSRNLRIEWKDLLASFPNVCYMEKVRCPNLNLFPCDDEGIWTKSGSRTTATRI